MQFAIALITLTISLITALFVFIKNPRSATNVYFSLLVFFISLYPIFNYLAVHSGSNAEALVWAKMILFVSIPQGPLLYFFAKTYPNSKFTFAKRRQIVILAWVTLNICLAFAGLIFKSVTVKDQQVSITPGPLVPSFGILHASTIIIGLSALFGKYRKAGQRAKPQLTYIFYGILISFSLTFLITFVLPIILKSTILLAISPVFLALAVVAAAYAIIRHRLFDIRLIVARSLGYVFSIGFLATLYGFTTSVIANLLADFSHTALITQLINVGLLAFAVLTYGTVKRFFERITNRIFYRDAYDPQLFLDQLNQILVASLELNILLRQTSVLIENNLKADFCSFLIQDKDEKEDSVVIDRRLHLGAHDQETVKSALTHLPDKVIVVEDLDTSMPKLRGVLQRHNIAVLIRLVDSVQLGVDQKDIGYIALGAKKSGNLYNKQDIQTLEIIANELVIAIQNALRFEEIQSFAATLQEKVNQATYKLQKSNEKLKALDETKDEFISMASHQLRTPLTSVKGYLSMVLEGDAGKLNDMQHKLLDQAFVSSQRMVYLIADLLNVSRLKTGKFIIEAIESNLADVVEGEVSQLVDTAKGRGLTLTYKKPKTFPTLMLDETKVRQVVMNFTDNAIYYTPSGGHITLNLVDKPESVEFTVVDDGIGVPKHEQHHLFSKFYRAGNAQKARPDGTGLGLFMAQKVIVAQGGSIIFHSKEGEGSTFGFSFPKAKLLPKTTHSSSES